MERVKTELIKAAFEAESTRGFCYSVTKPKSGGILRILTETQEDRKLSLKVTEGKNTNVHMVNDLIDSIFLSIKSDDLRTGHS